MLHAFTGYRSENKLLFFYYYHAITKKVLICRLYFVEKLLSNTYNINKR